MRRWWVWALVFALGLASGAAPVRADGAWLDEKPIKPWNQAGMSVPRPLAEDAPFPANEERCAARIRQPENAADQAVVDAGWTLYESYRAGWGISVVFATVGTDGMCRPWGYQQFVFVNGVFAGTVSPVPMYSRTDGSGSVLSFDGDGRISASFARYDDKDPLCCPSKPSAFVEFKIDRNERGSFLALANQ